MIQIEEKEIVKGIDEAYKKGGSNAYFGNGFQAGVEFALKQVKNLTIPVVVRSAFLVQHKYTLINHGLFDSEEKAKKYINGCDAYAIQEVQIA